MCEHVGRLGRTVHHEFAAGKPKPAQAVREGLYWVDVPFRLISGIAISQEMREDNKYTTCRSASSVSPQIQAIEDRGIGNGNKAPASRYVNVR